MNFAKITLCWAFKHFPFERKGISHAGNTTYKTHTLLNITVRKGTVNVKVYQMTKRRTGITNK